jgi:hypothetical protein
MPPVSNISTLDQPLAEDHRIQSWTAYSAPIQRIPSELLCDIFAWHCLSWKDHYSHPTDEPVVLSSVCRRWRDVATSNGKLWAEIDVVTDTDGSIPWRSLIELRLSRSKTAPLAIKVTQGTPGSSSFSTMIPILCFLRPYLLRAKSFQLLFLDSSTTSTHQLPTFGNKTFCPLLRSVVLLTDNLSLRDMTWLSTLLFPAPDLSEVYWGSEHCLDQVNWGNLRSLKLDPGSLYLPPQWLDTLCCGEELRHLHLHTSSPEWEDEGHVEAILPKLESLTLRSHQPFGPTLDWFTLPKLQTLVFQAHLDSPDLSWPLPEFRAFLSRSSCTLTELIFSDTRFLDRQLSECLALLPSLSKLRILCTSIPMNVGATIKLLTPPISTVGGSPPQFLCPNLTAITLWKCGLGEDGLFGRMVARRRTIHSRGDGSIAQLQYVEVQFYSWLLEYAIQNIRRLVDCEAQGVDVIMRSPDWSRPHPDIVVLRTQFSS